MSEERFSPPRITIRVKRNGPYLIEVSDVPNVRIAGAGDETLIPEPGRIVLCRCGGSSTKPFCDGTHKRNGFTDPARGSVVQPGGHPGDGPGERRGPTP